MTSGATASRAAVVTGAGSGLGAQIAADLEAAGFRVSGADISAPSDDGGSGLRFLDVRDSAACRALADEVEPDVWVNCAGVLGAGDAATQDDDVIAEVIAVNLLGVINGTRAAVASMRRRGGRGHVVNVASLAAWVPVPGECVYAASKAGVLSFTIGLRGELRQQGLRDIELSVVCPDGMLTPMITEVLDDPAIALTFSAPHLATVEQVSARILQVLRRPRVIASVPRWRGAQVRVLGMVPDIGVRALPLFRAIGQRNQSRVLAQWRSAQPNRPEM